ncbi:ArnT family glycosyltransferase [Elioraea rosea]|uniref:ArnT family glycosyltransferase n=1 Tax=Elioraea rosea TaxID=2492390 RepID=UPI0011833BF4|nr:glycosyltransferase family 39 protein [Elioraea rosea]
MPNASEQPWFPRALALVGAITLLRVFWLAFNTPDLYADEAQYWVWAQDLRLGYVTKPPLVAWLIAGTTALCGPGEGCIRLSSPLLHAGTALLLCATAARLFGARAALWAASVYATLPAVSVSSAIVSTDAALLFAWAAALHALVRLREGAGLAWWAVLGLSLGLGFLAKYAMVGFLGGLVLTLILDREARSTLLRGAGPWLAAALALAVLTPNLAWNLWNGFATVRHVGENANLGGGPSFNPIQGLEFLGAQFGVFGPITFALLLWVLSRRATWADPATRMLALFAAPMGALMLAQSFASRANANWAAPIYVAGTLLVVAWALAQGRALLLRLSVGLHVAAALILFAGPPAAEAAGFSLPRGADPWMRQRGWATLGEAVSRVAAENRDARLLFEQRRDMATLIYYVRPHPLDARMWEADGIARNEFELTAALQPGERGPLLFVTRRDTAPDVFARFERVEQAGRITVPTHRNAALRYTLWRLEGFRGYRD